MEFNKIHRKQDLNVFYYVCVFQVYRRNKIAAPACDWLRHFRFLLWNHWMEFNKIWQDARSQRPLISLCFSGRSEEKDGRPASDLPRHFDFSSVTAEQDSTKLVRKQDLSVLYQFVLFGPIKKAALGLWLAETFSTSPLWPLNRIQRNLTGSKISTSSTKFVLFDRRKLTGSKISNVLYKVFLGADEKNKMAAPASDWLRHFRLLLWTEFNKTWLKIRYVNAIFQVCVFRADRKNILLMFTICGPWASCLWKWKYLKCVGFARANDIVISYHNLSYSLNWSAVDRGTSRRPTANFYADFAATSAIVMKWWLRRGTEWLLWLRLYQNKRHCFKERCQYYLRMSCLFFYAWQTHNYKRLKLFFVIYMYYNNYIYLTHGLHIPCETSADPEGGTGVTDPPPLRFVKGGVLWRGLIGRRGGPTVVLTLLLSTFLARIARHNFTNCIHTLECNMLSM